MRALYILLCLFILCSLMIACGGRKKSESTDIPPIPVVPTVEIKPTINVYVENSGSMDGYVKGVTDFEHAIYSYLSDVKITGIADSINLYYINSQIIPTGSDIADFISKLEPSSFTVRGGNRGVSDIANVLKAILNETTDNTVSIFISDCVFSPGRGKDASEYLISQQIGIKSDVAPHIEKYPETAFAIYRLTSQFNGTYYNCYDAPTFINDRRPFFIWLIGGVDHILALQKRIPNSHFKGSGITDSYTLLPQSRKIDFYIPLSPKFGTFKFDRRDQNHITAVKKATKGTHKGKFMFTVEVDFSDLKTLLEKEYLCNTENYSLTINGRPSEAFILSITENPVANARYTHRIQLTSIDAIPIGNVQIELINKAPSWITTKNDDEGINIHAIDAMDKTYGIKYLIGGVEDAYRMVVKETGDAYQSYAKMNVLISK